MCTDSLYKTHFCFYFHSTGGLKQSTSILSMFLVCTSFSGPTATLFADKYNAVCVFLLFMPKNNTGNLGNLFCAWTRPNSELSSIEALWEIQAGCVCFVWVGRRGLLPNSPGWSPAWRHSQRNLVRSSWIACVMMINPSAVYRSGIVIRGNSPDCELVHATLLLLLSSVCIFSLRTDLISYSIAPAARRRGG